MFVNNNLSQISEIITHLRKYKTITSYEAILNYGATRLSGIIFTLKERGFGIRTEIVQGKNRYGNITHYAVYHLEKDIEQEERK